MRQSQHDILGCVLQPVFTLGQATYIPHYLHRETWVGLGGEELMTSQLSALGARLDYMNLWERPWTKVWAEKNAKKYR